MRTILRIIFCFAVLLAGIFWWVNNSYYSPGPLPEEITLVFPPNTHFTTIADTLAQKHVIAHPFLFKLLVAARGDSARFKAGEYAFPPYIAARDVADMMATGRTVVHRLTIAEGLMTSEILQIIKNTDGLDGEITLDPQEGDLLPETYNYSRGDKRNDLVTRMHHAMQKALEDAWEGREEGLPLTTQAQALTLASIVEKETGLASERSHVASVYINRLKKGMLLQADPTTAYAITGGKHKLARALTYADLETDSPYNTYRVQGLPPGPIANPGRATILATMHPDQTEDLYFVATGTGGHNFAKTEVEHEENVRKYREQENLNHTGGAQNPPANPPADPSLKQE